MTRSQEKEIRKKQGDIIFSRGRHQGPPNPKVAYGSLNSVYSSKQVLFFVKRKDKSQIEKNQNLK